MIPPLPIIPSIATIIPTKAPVPTIVSVTTRIVVSPVSIVPPFEVIASLLDAIAFVLAVIIPLRYWLCIFLLFRFRIIAVLFSGLISSASPAVALVFCQLLTKGLIEELERYGVVILCQGFIVIETIV